MVNLGKSVQQPAPIAAERKPPKQSSATARRTPPTADALVEAPAEKCFWVNFGPVLKDLRDLRDALRGGISEEQFAHHVGPGKNDFAAWVEEVPAAPACAQALRKVRPRRGALRAAQAYLP